MHYSVVFREYNPARELARKPAFWFMLFAILHPILALAMRASELVSTIHALFTLVIGLMVALFSKEKEKVGYACAYIAGAEVLWRMTSANIFWESGKYFTILLFSIALIRVRPWRKAGLPLLYFFLLCLSIPLTISSLGISGGAQDAISFNLSGPFALMVCALFFFQLKIDLATMERLAWWLILPILGIAALVLINISTSGTIVFTNESNFATSGGFGPNQVSAALGLGGGLALILFLIGRGKFRRISALILALGMLVLSVLTFSRGGFYNSVAMVALALFYYLRTIRGRILAIFGLLGFALVINYFVFPTLDSYTGGMLVQRFSNFDTTLREQISQADIHIWLTNPLLGVGPGMAKTAREILLNRTVAAHTEYTRALAEHGIAGLLSLVILITLAIRAFYKTAMPEARTWVVALLVWPFMEMSHSDMRIVAISFLFGLAMVGWQSSNKSTKINI